MSQPYAPRRSAEQWQALVDHWHHSGQSAKQFCRDHNLGYASFCRWRKHLSEPTDDPGASQPSFLDLSSLGPSSAGGWHIVLSLGNGVELTLSQR